MNRPSDLEKHRYLDKRRLDSHHFTLSLLQNAHRLGLIDKAGMDSIQSQVMDLLAAAIRLYTRGESTSVKNETAQGIMLSLFYAMDACLRSPGHPDEALEQLQARGLASIHSQGLAILESCLLDTRRIYENLLQQRLKVANLAYQSTLEEALPDFFNHYDVRFAAHETMASIDYPLLLDDMKVSGVFYIRKYLQTLTVENSFCRRYSTKEVKNLLTAYGRTYRININEALINIFEIVATNAMFSLLAGNPAQQLSISKAQLESLYQVLSAADESGRLEMLGAQAELLLVWPGASQDDYNLTPDEPWAAPVPVPGLKQLLEHLLTLIMPRLNRALEFGNLENVVIVSSKAAAPDAPRIVFNAGIKMDDDSFRELIGDIMACRDGAQKAALITGRSQSLADFIDILEADCLFEGEYQALYARLGEMELALLARILFVEEIRSDGEGFCLRPEAGQAFDYPWQAELSFFLQNLPAHRIKLIEHLIHSSLETEI